MHLKRLALTDFRNYRRCVWEPSASITVLTGENGSGKTNLLEAVSLLAPGRGLRGVSIQMLPRQGAERWGIAATLSEALDEYRIGTGSDPAGNARRVFMLDGEKIRSQAEIGNIFSCVWLTPQMDRLFLEGASGRRRFLDRLVMALSPDHARQIAAHDRSVSSRNRLLSERPNESGWIASLEDSIARHSVAATAARFTLIERMNGHPSENKEFPRTLIHLNCPIATRLQNSPALSVEDWLRGELAKSRDQDRQKGSTSAGAHRADFSLSDAETGRSAEISSSGQQKAMLLGTVLSHAHLIKEARGSAPAILLDEPLVHLDERRRDALLESIAHVESPVLLTGTDPQPFERLRGHAGFVSVASGTLKPH
ncbi:DNA replication/repair protein RecF [Gluconobacter wancherniae]|uniref:DNA replication/repair protein RecF n=1 Tax=Gluconobacter wancherniae TaxID=1307955 RepID=UPI0030A155B2